MLGVAEGVAGAERVSYVSVDDIGVVRHYAGPAGGTLEIRTRGSGVTLHAQAFTRWNARVQQTEWIEVSQDAEVALHELVATVEELGR